MPSDKFKWIPETFSTFQGGVSSSFDPDLIRPDQIAWAKNMDLRGGKPRTRGAYIERLRLPFGRVQGFDYFSINNGNLIFSIDGFIHQLGIGRDEFTIEELPTPQGRNPGIEQVFMVETSGFFVIQDGSSTPIIYDGTILRNATSTEVPKGFQMAYGNGRLWVALSKGRVRAGDITATNPLGGSELNFIENVYLLGGGEFVMPADIIGMSFMPANDGTTGFGPLVIWGRGFTVAMRADIAQRDEWSNVQGFQSTLFPERGATGHFSVMTDNQDLMYRDNDGRFTNLRQAIAEYGTAGSASASREVSRITDRESSDMLLTAHSMSFRDRMLAAAGPRFIYQDQVGFRSMISLDFSPAGSMAGKAPAIYNGEWQGMDVTHTKKIIHEGVERAFLVSKDKDGHNRLWEYVENETFDISLDPFSDPLTVLSVSSITSVATVATATTVAVHNYSVGDTPEILGTQEQAFAGAHQITATPSTTTFEYNIVDQGGAPATGSNITSQTGGTKRVKNKIVQEIEFRKVSFGTPNQKKRLQSFEIWASEIEDIKVTLFYRIDSDQQWLKWDTWTSATIVEDTSLVDPHVFKELKKGQEPQVIPFTSESLEEAITGFYFQVKLQIEGHIKIDLAVGYSEVLPNQDTYANDDTRPTPTVATENEITPIELFYEIPVFNPVLGNYVDESGDTYVDELAVIYTG